MVRSDSNTAELISSYGSLSDSELFDVTASQSSVGVDQPINKPVIKADPQILTKAAQQSKRSIIYAAIIVFLFFLFLIGLMTNWFQWSGFSNKLIEKYENKAKSQFTNKDQVNFDTDYDINYLVEQMIYKEFSPKDKKKYLNLPEALKDSLLKDYLIEKI